MFDPSLFSIVLAAAASQASPDEQFQRWEDRLRARAERLNVVLASAQDIAPCEVAVRFAVDRRGRATRAQLEESTCPTYYERKAVKLVGDLGWVGAVPLNAGEGRGVVLKLNYGTRDQAISNLRTAKR